MARVRDTALYTATCDYVKPLTKRQYEHELACLKKARVPVNWQYGSVGQAFIWRSTPQGGDYWEAVDSLIHHNKYGGVNFEEDDDD